MKLRVPDNLATSYLYRRTRHVIRSITDRQLLVVRSDHVRMSSEQTLAPLQDLRLCASGLVFCSHRFIRPLFLVFQSLSARYSLSTLV